MIHTERLTIRPFTLGDKEFLYELNNTKEVNKFMSIDSATMDYCIDSIKDWNEKFGDGILNVYLIEITKSEEAIGLVGVFKRDVEGMAELGYRILPKYWGQGYCKEATSSLIKKYFADTKEKQIFAETHPDNFNSIRFLERNKFVEETHDMEDRGKIFFTSRDSWL